MRLLAETLFWDELGFKKEMQKSPINFRLRRRGPLECLAGCDCSRF
jgi:hypothetical protein